MIYIGCFVFGSILRQARFRSLEVGDFEEKREVHRVPPYGGYCAGASTVCNRGRD